MNEAREANIARLEAALDAADPYPAAYALAVELRDGGLTQPQLLDVFETVRARHADDADERRLDAVLDVMDFITGWCSPAASLYPEPPPTSEA